MGQVRCRAGFQPLSRRGKFEVSEMELRNPCLDFAFVSKVCFRGAEWSHREVNDFGNFRVASQELTEGWKTLDPQLIMCLVKKAES